VVIDFTKSSVFGTRGRGETGTGPDATVIRMKERAERKWTGKESAEKFAGVAQAPRGEEGASPRLGNAWR
jgi:hypothetical protein